MYPFLDKLVQIFNMKDSFRFLHPRSSTFSHFYHTVQQGEGATRLDRSYNWGEITAMEARYVPVSFSDHLAYVVNYSLPVPMARILSPRSRPLFKIKPEVIKDQLFKERLAGLARSSGSRSRCSHLVGTPGQARDKETCYPKE